MKKEKLNTSNAKVENERLPFDHSLCIYCKINKPTAGLWCIECDRQKRADAMGLTDWEKNTTRLRYMKSIDMPTPLDEMASITKTINSLECQKITLRKKLLKIAALKIGEASDFQIGQRVYHLKFYRSKIKRDGSGNVMSYITLSVWYPVRITGYFFPDSVHELEITSLGVIFEILGKRGRSHFGRSGYCYPFGNKRIDFPVMSAAPPMELEENESVWEEN